MHDKKIAILGAGISGLTTAWYLKKKGYDVTVYEKTDRPGGQIETELKGDYLLDKGTIACIETNSLIPELVKELKLEDSFFYAGEKGNLKQAYIGSELYDLSMNPNNLLKFPLFSFKTKLKFFLEPFIPRSKRGAGLAVAPFIRRRLGEEFLKYVIEPFSSEVYAGDPERLSIEAAYPKLFDLEQKYGSIIKGFRKAPFQKDEKDEFAGSGKLFGFEKGMGQLTDALAKSLGIRINYLHDILKIEKFEDSYNLVINKKGDIKNQKFDVVVTVLPAFVVSDSVKEMSEKLAGILDRVEYVPLTQVYMAFLKQDLEMTTKGYTVLIPATEKKDVLNIALVSDLLPGRCPEERRLFSVMMGGSRGRDIFNLDPVEVKKKAIAMVSEIFKAKDKPVFISVKSWKKAVPQYNTDHLSLMKSITEFENEHRGLFISGNFTGGVSIGDSILHSYRTAERVSRILQ